MPDSTVPFVEPPVQTDIVPRAQTATPRPPRGPIRLLITLLASVVVPLVFLSSVGLWAGLNRQYIADQWTVWNYESTPAIDGYIDDSTMTDHALFLFKASKPRVAPDSEFNSICGSNEGGDGVLGCYTLDNKRITLFEIADKRLRGLQEAVATHEMLHAAWDRLSTGERDHLATLLDVEFDRLADDEQFQAQIRAYHFGTSDEVRYNELHSLIGTEVSGVSKELEAYYSRYFEDRAALVALYTSANDVLVEIGEAVAALNEELEALGASITADVDRYEAGYAQLDLDVDAFGARNEAYYYKTQRAFDADRNALIARGAELDALYTQIDARITEYNEKLEQLTQLDAEAADLYSSINLDPQSLGL